MKLFGALLAALAIGYVEAAYNLAGPYEINVLAVDKCETEYEDQVEFTSKVTKKSKTSRVWESNVTLPCDYDENSKSIVNVCKWGSGGWQQNAYHLEERSPCEWVKENVPDLHEALTSSGNVPAKCPIKAGNYSIKNFPTKWGPQKRFPSLPYGRYKFEIKCYCQDVMFYCLVAHLDISEIPRK